MYKYQENIIESIDDAIYKIEEMTEEHYRVHIGYRHTNNFEEENIPIFVEVNGDYRFTQQTRMDENYDCVSKCEINNYDRVELLEDVFLDLNKLIDKVLNDNKKRKAFYEKLSVNLEALNKTLAEI